ncbi:MAG: amino acid ABC transporter substrate-binding protein [Desulfobacteraceae bacterium]
MRFFKIGVFLFSVVFIFALDASFAGTLEDVREKGFIQVGVNEALAGFSMPDKNGVWRGLDVDTARAVSCAVFGTPDKLKFTPLTAQTRFTALQSGEIDLLCRNATHTLGRDTKLGLNFASVNFYDGQGFMVPKSLGLKSANELSGATICVLQGTTTEQNAADFFKKNNMKWKPVVLESTPAIQKAFFAGRCDCMTSDASQLAGLRTGAADPGDYEILPERISKEPLSPAVRHGDDQWLDIVNFSFLALVQAEEFGITSKNVDKMLKSNDPKIKRFLGVTRGNGEALGLDEKFACNIIKHVGNYAEVFDRNVGPDTPLGLTRGLNAQWQDGGLMYSPPFK